MFKKISKITIILIIAFLLAYLSIYYIQNQTLKRSYVSYNEGQGEDSFVRCNLNIFRPEFANVFFALNQGHIGFRTTKMFFQTDEEWKQFRTGGTTVQNTTFPELLAMVKEDCGQFQKAKGDFRDETINWSYSDYVPEPIKTAEQMEEEAFIQKRKEIEEIKYILEEMLPSEMVEEMINKFGDWKNLEDDELIEWFKKAKE